MSFERRVGRCKSGGRALRTSLKAASVKGSVREHPPYHARRGTDCAWYAGCCRTAVRKPARRNFVLFVLPLRRGDERRGKTMSGGRGEPCDRPEARAGCFPLSSRRRTKGEGMVGGVLAGCRGDGKGGMELASNCRVRVKVNSLLDLGAWSLRTHQGEIDAGLPQAGRGWVIGQFS